MLQRLIGLVMTVVVYAAFAQTSAPAFEPATLKGPKKGAPNEVLVLGTTHLRTLPPTFEPANLRLLNARLVQWKPLTIAIESLSGPQCAYMRQYPPRYGDLVKIYCRDTAPAQAATGLDVPAATAEADRLLATWPAAPSASQRRHLAAVFLAGGEPFSALVQWLRLPVAERQVGDGLDTVLVETLEQLRCKSDEDSLIAAPVAAAVALERLVAMDDHTAGASDPADADEKAFGAALAKAWDNPALARRSQMDERFRGRLNDPEGIMMLYRALNDPAQARLIFDSDFGAALEEPSPEQFGRSYVTYWEIRNLRMASNIRDAIGKHPGRRTLVIVGQAHKWYLEAYLHQMHDVRLVSTEVVLHQD